MSTVGRSLVRITNYRLGIDTHRFIYGCDDPFDPSSWVEAMSHLRGSVDIPNDIDWIGNCLEKMAPQYKKHYGSYHEDGWLVSLRHDRVNPARSGAAMNDNEANEDDSHKDDERNKTAG